MFRFVFLFLFFFVNSSVACTYVETLEINNPKIISDFDIQLYKEQIEGSCISVDEIKILLSNISEQSAENGYIMTHVALRPKAAASKTLTIDVIPAKIANSNVFTTGEYLNIRDVEQYIERINALNGYKAKSSIRPGNEPYTSDVDVDLIKQKWGTVSVSMDNHGTENSGINQSYISAFKYNALGLYDTLGLEYKYGFSSGIKHKLSQGLSATLTIPYHYWSLNLSSHYYDYKRSFAVQRENLIYTGATYNHIAELSRVMFRNSFSKTSLVTALTLKDTSNYIQRTLALNTQTRKLTIGSVKLTEQIFSEYGDLTTVFSYYKGLSILGAERRSSGLINSKAQFSKTQAVVSYVKPFAVYANNFSFDSLIYAQFSDDILYDSEQFSIGSADTIRAFRETQFSGESGWFIKNNLNYHLPANFASDNLGRLSVFLGFDYGEINKNRLNILPYNKIAGSVIGLKNDHEHLAFQLAFTHPIRSLNPNRARNELLFSIATQL